jgi:glycosyltransferase involved in cell wall biosynthesis
MNKNEVISVVVSTRKRDEKFVDGLKKLLSHPKSEVIVYENDNKYSLAEIYNKGLKESKNDIVVFMHDDLIIDEKNLTPKVVKLFDKNPEYGIIGVAGTDKLTTGRWWEDRETMYGKVAHIQDKKRHVNKYSKQTFPDIVKEVVTVDGLLMMVHKKRIKHTFNEEFKGFHFYDLPICVENYLDGVKIGVTTRFDITHKSIGEVNKKWEKNKYLFEALYEKNFPLVVAKNLDGSATVVK